MTKLQKRILKTSKRIENCLLIGEGFGFLENFIEVFKTVFVINNKKPSLRTKNLIFRSNEDDLSQLTDITHIIFDRKQIIKLEKFQYLWNKHNSIILIEGNEPIEREFSKSLYNSGWQCTDTQGFFHVWERIR